MRRWQPAFPSAAIVQPGARLKTASFPIERIRGFCKLHQIEVLNIAGPRASQWDDGFDFARETVSELLSQL